MRTKGSIVRRDNYELRYMNHARHDMNLDIGRGKRGISPGFLKYFAKCILITLVFNNK